VAFLFILPFLSQDEHFINIFLGYIIKAMIFAMLAASWDFLAGISGQVNFGYAVLFGVGGYAYAYYIKIIGFPFISALIMGAIFTVGIAIFISLLCMRVKGPYFALITLVLGIIFLYLFMMNILKDWFFGTGGIPNLPNPFLNEIQKYIIILIFMLVTIISLIGISKTKLGTILKSIRDDELGARASGINTNKYKLIAFMISGFFAGLAGIFFAANEGTVNPTNNFGPVNSFYPIIMASLGGVGTIIGGPIGAFVFFIAEYIITGVMVGLFQLEFEVFDINFLNALLIFSVVLIIVILFARKGIVRPAIERLKKTYDLLVGK